MVNNWSQLKFYFFIFFITIGIYNILLGQDTLLPLSKNVALNTRQRLELKSTHKLNYLVENAPIQLPFQDDFSEDHTLPYDPKNFVSSTIFTLGNCNEVARYQSQSIKFSQTRGKQYTCNPTTQTVDSSVLLPTYEIRMYSESKCRDYSIVGFWSKSYYRYTFDVSTCQILDSTLVYDTVINAAEVHLVSIPSLKWVDNDVYINRHFAHLPPTLGVSTFDGLNSLGRPYQSLLGAQGEADRLTSVPIDLSANSDVDNIILSFFVQPQGYGDFPDSKDSLLVQMLDSTGTWNTVWGINHTQAQILDKNLRFNQYFVKIPQELLPGDPFYYHSKFQFRFVSKATLTGNNDHWHIDYVRIAANRSVSDSNFIDFAFQHDLPSPLANYTILPAKQFRGSIDLIDTLKGWHTINDLNTTPLLDYQISVSQYNPNSALYASNPIPFIVDKNYSISAATSDFNIPNSVSDSTTFEIKYYTRQADNVLTNDTARTSITFFNEIAYDDGTAEMAYGVQGPGQKKVALKYKIPFQDTLAAVKVMFSNIDEALSNMYFDIEVWESIDIFRNQERSLAKLSNRKPIYYDKLNQFAIFGLKEPVIVKDSFYIGWSQIDNRNLQIGYDRNSHLGLPNVYIFTDNSWKLSNVITPGSPMIRAILDGTRDYRDSSTSDIKASPKSYDEKFSLYPNPTSHSFKILNLDVPAIVSVYDLNGRLVQKTELQNVDASIDISELQNGFYIVTVETKNVIHSLRIYKN